jgi:hypothetical protein
MLRIVGVATFVIVVGVGLSNATAHDANSLTTKFVRAEQAIAEAAQSRDDVVSSSSLSPDSKQAAESFYYAAFVWDHPEITVCFWQTNPEDDALIDAIMETASRWTKTTRIDFVYKENGAIRRCHDSKSADIRATLDPMSPSYYMPGDPIAWDWARYGRIAGQNDAKVSMSLVHARQYFLTGDISDLHFLAAHEPGHALGLIHEHQRLDCVQYLDDAGIKRVWPNWTDQDIAIFKQNLAKIPASNAAVAIGSYDLRSVMMYNFDQRIWRHDAAATTNPCARPSNVEYPSPQDIAGVERIYGVRAPSAPPVAAASTTTTPAASPPPSATESRQVLVEAAHDADQRARVASSQLENAARGGAFGGLNPALKAQLENRIRDHQHDREAIQVLLSKVDAAVAAAAQ